MAIISTLKSHIFACFVCLCCLFGLVNTFQFGSASLDFYMVKNVFQLWQDEQDQQSLQQYEQAKDAIYSANKSHPNHPLYIDLIGQINEWGAIAEYDDPAESLQAAKAYYLNATKLRPTWPVTWASLVMVKWRLQEFDDEMLVYLNNADHFGPKKPEVNILFAELGIALYKSNHNLLISLRDRVEHRLVQGLSDSKSRDRIIRTITEYQVEKQVCRWLREEPYMLRKYIPNCKR